MIDSLFYLEACIICSASEFLWGNKARGLQCAGVLRLQAGRIAEGGVLWVQPLHFQTAPHHSDSHLSGGTGLVHGEPTTLLKGVTELLGPHEPWEEDGFPVQREAPRETLAVLRTRQPAPPSRRVVGTTPSLGSSPQVPDILSSHALPVPLLLVGVLLS